MRRCSALKRRMTALLPSKPTGQMLAIPYAGHVPHAAPAQAPAFFPPSVLYTQSWEDPVADEPHLQVRDILEYLDLPNAARQPQGSQRHDTGHMQEAALRTGCNPRQQQQQHACKRWCPRPL